MRRASIGGILALALAWGPAATPAPAGVESILGKWAVKSETANGTLEVEFDLRQEGGSLIGTASTFEGPTPFSTVKFDDPNLSVELDAGGTIYRLTGLLKEGRLAGTWEQVGTEMKGTWVAERKGTPARPAAANPVTPYGNWNAVAVTPSGDFPFQMELKQAADGVALTLSGPEGSIPAQKAVLKDNRLTFEVDYMGGTYRLELVLADDKWTGTWSAVGGGESGPFSAVRK